MKHLKYLVCFGWLLFGIQNTYAQTIYDLVMEQRPATLSDIKFNTGWLSSTRWVELNFTMFESPDSTSAVIYEKKNECLYKDGGEWCVFESGVANSCFKYLVSSDSNDLPIAHSLAHSDMLQSKRAMWYQLELDGRSGWMATPIIYFSSEPFVSTNRKYITSNPYVRWLPTNASDTLLADVGRQSNHPLMTVMNENRRLQVKDEIRWVGDTPVLEVCVVEKLDDDAWCFQNKLPKIIACGVMRMFLADGRMSVYQIEGVQCD